jgi:DNA-binding NarL/FixJ family response regulator
MTLARGNHRLPSVDESWPYPDAEDEQEGGEEVDLDVLELRVDPRAYMSLDSHEREVLFLRFGLSDGRARSMKEIARTLEVTVNTVEFHLSNAYAKLGVRSRTQHAARLAAGTPGGHRET